MTRRNYDDVVPCEEQMAKLTTEEKERRAANRRRANALRAEAQARRIEARRNEWNEQGTQLTRVELGAGVKCRGCGLAIIDGLGDRPPLVQLTSDERREYEASEADFGNRHRECRSHRWSLSGSRTIHCGYCCPPPPMSEQQLQKVRAIMTMTGPPDLAQLDTWRLTLTCDHVIDKTQHHTNTYWSASTVCCPQCQETRGIVTSEKLPASSLRRAAESTRLATELEATRRELAKHQKKVEAAQRRLGTTPRRGRHLPLVMTDGVDLIVTQRGRTTGW
jgi:Skp family chaperone for outer membrane proteins